MAGKDSGPSLRAQWLAQQLRKMRETSGYKLPEAAEYLERSPATMSRLETAEYPVRRGDLLALLDLYDVSDEQRRDGFIRMREEAWRKGWWEKDYAGHVSGPLMDYTWLEDRATAIRSLDLLAVPGLLQIPEYAEALITATNPAISTEETSRLVEFRLARQRVLDADEPPQVTTVLDEALLHRRVGGPNVLRAQLQDLARMAQRPSIDIRVLPFGAGAHAGNEGAFALIELPEPYPAVAFTETPAGGLYVEAPNTDKFLRAYDQVWQDTLGADESAELISATAEELQ